MNDIMMLYYEINNIYLEMFKLELSNNKNSVSFLEMINLLGEKRIEEERMFKSFFNNLSNEDYDKYESLDEVIDNPLIKRFSDYIRFNNELNININDDNVDRVNYAKIYIACTRNIFLIYLSFLQELIDDDKYISFRKKLISYKYYNSFICHDVEYSNILNNFNVDKNNYLDLYFVGRMLKIDYKEVDKIIFECLEDTIMTSISTIMSFNDDDYNEPDKYVVSLNSQCMLRAGISIISESEYYNIVSNIDSLIEELYNDNKNISLDNINLIINDRKKSKGRIIKISFGNICE